MKQTDVSMKVKVPTYTTLEITSTDYYYVYWHECLLFMLLIMLLIMVLW